tara:strand:+ start:308 stop:451 length:144 start_codon:yes stop_codon:yes gene_type:complete
MRVLKDNNLVNFANWLQDREIKKEAKKIELIRIENLTIIQKMIEFLS